MRNDIYLVILLLGITVLFGSCSKVEILPSAIEESAPEPQVNTPTTRPPTTTTIQEVVVDLPESTTSSSTTTTTVFVDYPDPIRMFSEALEIDDASVSTESRKTDENDPLQGAVQWVPVGDRDPGPCEMGMVMMASHVNKGEPHYNLVDDSSADRHGDGDHGLVLNDVVSYELADGQICKYGVIEPLGINISGVKKIESQPAIYFIKHKEVMNPILASLIQEVGDRKIVSMWVSYGGPGGKEFEPDDDRHRLYNAVVFAELIEEDE